MKNVFDQVQRNIDRLVEEHVNWSAAATQEQLRAARTGQLKMTFGADGVIPADS